MRERRRREVFEKAEKEEEREKAIFARFAFLSLFVYFPWRKEVLRKLRRRSRSLKQFLQGLFVAHVCCRPFVCLFVCCGIEWYVAVRKRRRRKSARRHFCEIEEDPCSMIFAQTIG